MISLYFLPNGSRRDLDNLLPLIIYRNKKYIYITLQVTGNISRKFRYSLSYLSGQCLHFQVKKKKEDPYSQIGNYLEIYNVYCVTASKWAYNPIMDCVLGYCLVTR